MATIGEKTGDIASLIDDIATLLEGRAAWSDADTDIVNDGTLNHRVDEWGWQKNARVFYNSNADVYVLCYLHRHQDNAAGQHTSGVGIIISEDWVPWTDYEYDPDTNPDGTIDPALFDTDPYGGFPGGRTTVGDDNLAWDGGLANHIPAENKKNNSFDTYAGVMSRSFLLAVTTDYADSATNEEEGTAPHWADTTRDRPCEYVLSAGDDYLTAGVHQTDKEEPGTYRGGDEGGWSSWFCLSRLTEKFFDDGRGPLVVINQEATSNGGGYHSQYNWDFYDDGTDATRGQFKTTQVLEEGDWGFLNNDPADETFFYRRLTLFASTARATPVAYLPDVVPMLPHECGAQGDTVTADGKTYFYFQKTGDSPMNNVWEPPAMGLRYD